MKIDRVDPNLNVSHLVDTRNAGYKAAKGRDIRNPTTGRLVIQMTKASKMMLQNGKNKRKLRESPRGR